MAFLVFYIGFGQGVAIDTLPAYDEVSPEVATEGVAPICTW